MRADDQDPLSTGMFYCKVNRMLWKLVMSLIIYFPSLSFSSYVFLGKKVLQRHFLRSGKVLGTFKLDVATVMAQPGIITVYSKKLKKWIFSEITTSIRLYNQHSLNFFFSIGAGPKSRHLRSEEKNLKKNLMLAFEVYLAHIFYSTIFFNF